MEMRLVDGRYVPDDFGGFETVTGAEETLERALYKLKARRGGFALMPELGSRLWLRGGSNGLRFGDRCHLRLLCRLIGIQGLSCLTCDKRE